ncbi:hypothetical protein F9278_04215 [Streptomyces phaeolivaceus]|uniref:DUF624 domain-containing protein n=1 Tax=Streptomyces phaeolivaceus TaxID=2653200 RepID=A0A5P8JYD9_9ACTN|nr:hypothetical protein [Streptomyces phaeolivaceus]QFQ95522.1 hypothetical protein F9278_04215 [Streptomyces phaeolivaceus]
MRRAWFHLFADCLLLGVFLLVCALPVVTAFPAFVAGCAVLREQAHGGPGVTPATMLAALRRVLRSGRAVWLVPTGAGALLWLDAVALDAHGPGMGVPVAVASTVLAALGLRCAAGWREGTSWRAVVVAAFRSMPEQPLVPVLLAGATVAVAALLAMSPVLLIVVLGPLALAATAADAWRPLSPAAPSPESSPR